MLYAFSGRVTLSFMLLPPCRLPVHILRPTHGQPRFLGTLSECLFFFGIYSFHFGGRYPWPLCLGSFWRRQRQPSPQKPKTMKDCCGARLSQVWVLWASEMWETFFVQRVMLSRMVPCMGFTPISTQIGGKAGFKAPLCTKNVAYGHTTGNTPEPVRFQKLSLVRPS